MNETELLKTRKHLIKSKAPDVAFEALNLAIPTQEERDGVVDAAKPDIGELKNILLDSLFKKYAPLAEMRPRTIKDIRMGFLVEENQVEFDLLTNVTKGEMHILLKLWAHTTSSHTPESLVEFINSKKEYGFYAELKK